MAIPVRMSGNLKPFFSPRNVKAYHSGIGAPLGQLSLKVLPGGYAETTSTCESTNTALAVPWFKSPPGGLWYVAKQSVLHGGVERRLLSLIPAPLRPGIGHVFSSEKKNTRDGFLTIASFFMFLMALWYCEGTLFHASPLR